MNYIERYIYAVKKHLPANQKEEVGAEIRTLILEQVSEDAPFEKIEKVLKSLGSPRKLAHSYRNQDRYLIGPEHFELYYDILKIGLLIIVPIAIFFGIIESLTVLFSGAEGTLSLIGDVIGAVIENVIGEGINALIMGFGLITLGFILAERFGWLNEHDEWMLKDLPEVPKNASEASFSFRATLFETIGVSLGRSVVLFVLRFPVFAFSNGDTAIDINIITPANYETYFPFFFLLINFYIVIQTIILIQKGLNKWTYSLRVIKSLSLIGVVGSMFFLSVFLTPQDIQYLADLFAVGADELETQINLILGTFWILLIADQSWNRYKDIKNLKKQKKA